MEREGLRPDQIDTSGAAADATGAGGPGSTGGTGGGPGGTGGLGPAPPPSGELLKTIIAPQRPPGLPERIGHYRIKRLIGQGGMGAVYEAMQEQPRRIVALKVMKPGMPASVLRRFEYESQILGRLRHPGIAQVYESGTHDEGLGATPYIAMEFVPGARMLTNHAIEGGLNVRGRLELFVQVCDAVHHGHQKGIIHRDLKPDNILVDSQGQPKIIDFGIARATDSDLAMTALQTRAGDLVGTVPYMSPEQCEADPNDLDMRTDVYSLGVVLYELLTGGLPYDLSTATIFEATRIIREIAPRPLSTASGELRGDVEAITFKALEKSRQRRYQSAGDLAADIRRFLNAEPITARPPSLGYQLRVFARRHKAFVAGAGAVLAALVIGFIGTAIGLVQARAARDLARTEAATAQKVTGYFQHMFSSLDAREGTGPNTQVKDLLSFFAEDLGTSLADEPEVRAAIEWSIGAGYKGLTYFDDAERHLRSALATQREIYAPPHEAIARTANDLAGVLYFKREVDEAEELAREALQMRRALRGPEHEDVASSLNYLAAIVDEQEDHQQAESLYRQALDMRRRVHGEEHEMVARATNNLASCLMRQQRHAEAAPLLEDAVRIVRRTRGDDHIDVAGGLSNLARCLMKLERYAEAEEDLRLALQIRLAALGSDHADVAVTLQSLAQLLEETERLDEALAMCGEAVRIRKATFQGPHPYIIESALLLATIHVARGDWAAAEPVLRELLDLRAARQPAGHWTVAAAEGSLGECLGKLGRHEAAEALLVRSYGKLAADRGPEHAETIAAVRRLVGLYEAWGRPERAAEYRELLPAKSAGEAP